MTRAEVLVPILERQLPTTEKNNTREAKFPPLLLVITCLSKPLNLVDLLSFSLCFHILKRRFSRNLVHLTKYLCQSLF